MQKAEVILSILRDKSTENENFVFDRLYRNLFNQDFFLRAYNEIYAKEGNMTPGTDGNTIDGFGYQLIEELIGKLKNESYYPHPVRRTYIPKKDGRMRPLGIPSFQDKIVQEILKLMLESIYEPLFLDSSHGFRAKRSCHTALYQIKQNFKGINWFIEGDIKGFFDNMSQNILLGLLKKKIKDGRIIEIIRRFLEAGYFEFHQVHDSLSGAPQGGIISPILSNIYLHELDKVMEKMEREINIKPQKKQNLAHYRVWKERDFFRRNGDYEKVKELTKKLRSMPSRDPFDKDYKRVRYVRYCDDFIVGIHGSKKFAEEIRERIKNFLSQILELELNLEKTLITHAAKERAKFLGYEINKAKVDTKIVVDSRGRKIRAVNGKIQLLVPGEVINKKLKEFRHNHKPVQKNDRVSLKIGEIIAKYNEEIRGLYNYYCLATDISTKLAKYKYYHYYSMVKTIAKKERASVRATITKYGIDVPRKQGTGTVKIIGIRYKTRKGLAKTLTYFNESLKKVSKPKTKVDEVISGRWHEIVNRLNAGTCELCGIRSKNRKDFVVHHVRKLKDLLEKYNRPGFTSPMWVLIMKGMQRKTLVVCENCHKEIHRAEKNS
ncbi:group II intron reverse transcriptase/maturase [Pelosinus sp. sgz500959]|uniref:group II intron reverse transcriptase/maturase n=1 Tax=Pelosinus sp. sgz500959 TaxID=3242472 RepID=UPI00366D992A